MHRVAWLLLILVSSAWIACEVDVGAPAIEPPSAPETTWRRTARGWEKSQSWAPPIKPYDPAIHPAIVAAAQLLVGLFFLAAPSVAIPVDLSSEDGSPTPHVGPPKFIGVHHAHAGASQRVEELAV